MKIVGMELVSSRGLDTKPDAVFVCSYLWSFSIPGSMSILFASDIEDVSLG